MPRQNAKQLLPLRENVLKLCMNDEKMLKSFYGRIYPSFMLVYVGAMRMRVMSCLPRGVGLNEFFAG